MFYDQKSTTYVGSLKRILKIITLFFLLFIFEACSLFRASVPEPDDLSSSIVNGKIKVGKLQRSFLYYLPKNLPNNAPIVIILHGSKGSGKQMREMTAYQFDILADHHKFITVYPDGYEGHWNGCRKSAKDTAHQLNIDDTEFITTLIEFFKNNNNINKKRVFLTGFSNGGHMCFRLASEIPERITAIAPLVAHVPIQKNSSCSKSSKSMSVLLCSGTEDPINPFEGGEVSILGLIKKGQVLSAFGTAKFFRDIGSINEESIETIQFSDKDITDDSTVELKKWRKPSGVEINLFIVNGGGHTMPGTPPYYPEFICGKTNQDINIVNETVSFFLRQRSF
jgi:polyhydroxybutyrate depolymerase